MPNSRISDLIKKTVLLSDGQEDSPDDSALFLIAREKSHNESMQYKDLKASINDHSVFVTGDQVIRGNKTFDDNITLESDLAISGDVTVSGDLAVSGDLSVQGDIFNLKFDDGSGGDADSYITQLDSNLDTKGALNVDLDATLKSDLTVDKDFTVKEESLFHGHVSIGDSEKGYLKMQSGGSDKIILDSDGTSFFQGGDVEIGETSDLKNLKILGKTTTNELEITQGTLIHQNLTVQQNAIIVNDATVQNNLTAEGTLTVNDNLLVTAPEARFAVDNAVFEKDVEIQGDLSVKGDLFNLKFDDGAGGNADNYLTQLDSNLITKGTLSVDLDSTLKSNLNTQGDVTFDQKLDVAGQTTISDKLGIGTNNPQKTLEVAGNLRTTKTAVDGGITSLDLNSGGSADHPKLSLYDKNGGNEVNLLYSRLQFTRDAEVFISSKSDLKFVTNGEDRVKITADGNVGIGTVSPSALLEVSGATNPEIRITDTNPISAAAGTFRAEDGGVTLGAYSNHSLYLAANNTTHLTITGAGNVGIGTTSPTSELQVVGDTNLGSLLVQSGSRFQDLVVMDQDVVGGNVGNDFNIYTNSTTADLNLGAGNTQDLITLNAQKSTNPSTGADSGQDILFNNSNVGINVPSVELSPVTQDKYKLHINGEVKLMVAYLLQTYLKLTQLYLRLEIITRERCRRTSIYVFCRRQRYLNF